MDKNIDFEMIWSNILQTSDNICEGEIFIQYDFDAIIPTLKYVSNQFEVDDLPLCRVVFPTIGSLTPLQYLMYR